MDLKEAKKKALIADLNSELYSPLTADIARFVLALPSADDCDARYEKLKAEKAKVDQHLRYSRGLCAERQTEIKTLKDSRKAVALDMAELRQRFTTLAQQKNKIENEHAETKNDLAQNKVWLTQTEELVIKLRQELNDTTDKDDQIERLKQAFEELRVDAVADHEEMERLACVLERNKETRHRYATSVVDAKELVNIVQKANPGDPLLAEILTAIQRKL